MKESSLWISALDHRSTLSHLGTFLKACWKPKAAGELNTFLCEKKMYVKKEEQVLSYNYKSKKIHQTQVRKQENFI